MRFIRLRRTLAILGGCAALCGFAALAFAQKGTLQEPAPAPGAIHAEVELVNLLCTVRDRSGAYVTNLSPEDFTVLENGRPQPITRFARQTDQALTVALLFDVSFSMEKSLRAETDDARQFFRDILRPGDAATLGGFAAGVGFWQTVTSSRPELEEALDHVPDDLAKALRDKRTSIISKTELPHGAMMLALGGDGGSRLYDAVDLISTQQLRHISGRKAIIALTDGQDEGSKRTLKEAVRSTQEADAIFFGIDPKEQVGPGMYILNQLSSQTGGSAFHIDKHTTLDGALRAIEEELRNQYAIGYAPPENSKKGKSRTGTFHKVEVRVNKPGFKVSVRSGYFR